MHSPSKILILRDNAYRVIMLIRGDNKSFPRALTRHVGVWNKRKISHCFFGILLVVACLYLHSCCTVKTTYKVTKGTVKIAYKVTKFAGKTVYTIGKFTFKVVMAPLTWPLAQRDIESIDDLPPKEAIKQGRVKTSPYIVRGKRYVPMNVKQAETYRQKGVASWYGYETY